MSKVSKKLRTKSSHVCEYWDKEFDRPSKLKEHRRVHTGERPFPCNLCSYSAAQKGALQVHIRCHLQEKMFKCPEPGCNYSAVTKGTLNNHRVVHTQEKRFSCSFSSCTFKTIRKDQLTRHAKTHQENPNKPFQCNLCPFKARNRENLNSHMSCVHSTDRKFKCEKEGCSYAGKTKKFLSQHLQAHGEKNLNCPHPNCGYRTNLKAGLKQHMEIHLDVKKYKCRICNHATRHSSDLTTHMRTHTKERPYKCPVVECPFAAATKSSLNSHVKAVHQKVGPFQCPSCDYASASKSYLKKHQNSPHPQPILIQMKMTN